MKKVLMYSVTYCPYCKKAKAILNEKGIEFEEIDITENETEGRKKLAELTGGKNSVPQIFVDEQHIGGCDDLQNIVVTGRFKEIFE